MREDGAGCEADGRGSDHVGAAFPIAGFEIECRSDPLVGVVDERLDGSPDEPWRVLELLQARSFWIHRVVNVVPLGARTAKHVRKVRGVEDTPNAEQSASVGFGANPASASAWFALWSIT